MDKNKLSEEFLSLVNVDRFDEHYKDDIKGESFFAMPLEPIVEAEKRLKSAASRNLAYFSMEYGLATSFYNTFCCQEKSDSHNQVPANTVFSNYRLADYFFDMEFKGLLDLPIYSGGLGVLAGDTVKTMADYKLPAVAVGILWHSGYFKQKFWFKYGQVPDKMHWHPHSYPGLIPLKDTLKLKINGGEISVKLWKYYVYSYKRDYAVPLILLDSDISQNSKENQSITDQLYRSDSSWTKIMQRLVLGFGGIKALEALGYNIGLYHLNEGHAIFAFIAKCRGLKDEEIRETSAKFVYTCHTPVEAGHDRFSQAELAGVLEAKDFALVKKFGLEKSGLINLTLLSMNACSSINAVSKRHRDVMAIQFPAYKERIAYVTNGVHAYTWISGELMKLFKLFPEVFKNIEDNPMILSQVTALKEDKDFRRKLWQAHQENKKRLCLLLEKWGFKENVFTLCWARRVAAYKRPSMILADPRRLVDIARKTGPLQIIFAGKAHPNDNLGFTFIDRMMDKVDGLTAVHDDLKIVMLENYDIFLGSLLTSSVDLWLNNPLPPFEASGTSGMKAILNAVVQLSTVDGWVAEAQDTGMGKFFGYRCKEGETGNEQELHMEDDADQLYKALEEMAGLYYKANNQAKIDYSSPWIDMMINCIAAGARFNTYRMLDEYKKLIWHIA